MDSSNRFVKAGAGTPPGSDFLYWQSQWDTINNMTIRDLKKAKGMAVPIVLCHNMLKDVTQKKKHDLPKREPNSVNKHHSHRNPRNRNRTQPRAPWHTLYVHWPCSTLHYTGSIWLGSWMLSALVYDILVRYLLLRNFVSYRGSPLCHRLRLYLASVRIYLGL